MRNALKVKRPDGLSVFPDKKDPEVLNKIRVGCPDKATVIMAVGMYRGMQIAMNYAGKHAPEVKNKIKNALHFFTQSLYLIEGRENGLPNMVKNSMGEEGNESSQRSLAVDPDENVEKIQTAEMQSTSA